MSKADQFPDVHCRIEEVLGAIHDGTRPASALGIVACLGCNGIFDVHLDAGEKPEMKEQVFVPCVKGLSTDLEASSGE